MLAKVFLSRQGSVANCQMSKIVPELVPRVTQARGRPASRISHATH